MFSRINSAVCAGIEGRTVIVETDVARGLPGMLIVGLASTMIMESRERIKSAIINSGLEYPHGRITVNLTPASQRKNGSCLDLPIATGILVSGAYIHPERAAGYGIIGELSLDGKVLGIDGVLPMMLSMIQSGINRIIIPEANAEEARLISGAEVYTVSSLHDCLILINDESGNTAELRRLRGQGISGLRGEYGRRVSAAGNSREAEDFIDISGQEAAKRAIVIAATGRHGLLMVGSPGCGKTMLASRIPGIMPPMTERELIDTAIIYSATGRINGSEGVTINRPFRSPHHTIGRAGLLGGGTYPMPGEITLAHNGVLMLDEVCEFGKDQIEGLRIPIEEKKITHFRQGESCTFPCDFQLVMASNPCPCGYFGDSDHLCKCSEVQLDRYRRKLSGPIMDRIDLRITMEKVTYDDLRSGGHTMSSAEMREMVERGMDFARKSGRTAWNSSLSEQDMDRYCTLGSAEAAFAGRAYDTFAMSPRSYKRMLRVSRTIADLAESDMIRQEHLAEALRYRMLERVNE